MKKNVLLLCMSLYQTEEAKEKEFNYRYDEEGKTYLLTGKMTNEAPTKYIMESLHRKGKHLDKIVLICSDRVMDEVCVGGKTHVERFKSVITEFSQQLNGTAETYPIQFEEIRIGNNTQSAEIAQAAILAAQKVEEGKGKKDRIDLYIDFNGGQRYLAFMIINVAHLMMARNVVLKSVTNMNNDNRIKGKDGKEYTPIQGLDEIFQIDALVSGIKEYVHYGRVQELKKYFADCDDVTINGILREMEKFVDELQMCQTEAVKKQRTILKEKLEKYLEDMKENPPVTPFQILFTYVVQDIINGYKEMFEGDMPEMISWCVKKGFMQQAVTFYAEQMPIYFYDHGILSPSKEGLKEYETEYKNMKDAYETEAKERTYINGKHSGGDLAKQYRDHYKAYDKKYCFMVKWIKPSFRGSLNEKQSKRIRSIIEKKKLEKVIQDYYSIKKIRNSANHASDKEVSLAEINKQIIAALNRLKSYTEGKE